MSDTSDLQRRLEREQQRIDAANEDTSIAAIADYVKEYAKQETLGPLKGAGRWLGFGLGGAALLAVGLSLILLGVLRAIQTEWTRSSTGSLSWLAYAITLVIALALLVLTLARIKKSTLQKAPK